MLKCADWPEVTLSTALQRYVNIPEKRGVGFSVIIQVTFVPTSPSHPRWAEFVDRMDAMFASDSYETVNGAPLVFVFAPGITWIESVFESVPAFGNMLQAWSAAARKRAPSPSTARRMVTS